MKINECNLIMNLITGIPSKKNNDMANLESINFRSKRF